ncbi:MAG: hypothetical protein WA964_08105 [Ilumatobacter sp.]|uniref:hypothetical protein n=1 Tax=Ilumatobacter sp. TaxID=1967498 RepID=UPI003C76832B
MSTATAATITISTTPMIESGTSIGRCAVARSPLVGLVARVVAGITGALFGLAIGLVSAGFDTTPLLLALGAVALGVGWIVAVLTGGSATSQGRW